MMQKNQMKRGKVKGAEVVEEGVVVVEMVVEGKVVVEGMEVVEGTEVVEEGEVVVEVVEGAMGEDMIAMVVVSKIFSLFVCSFANQ